MKAIMLCAGEGTRCYPFTHLSPKISQEVCGIPILEYMLSWFGGTPEIEKLYIVVKYDFVVEALKKYVQERRAYLEKIMSLFSRLGYKVEYTNPNFEIEALRANGWGTGADLRSAIRQITSRDELDDDFVVCNGDYVTLRKLPDDSLSPQFDLSGIISYHKSSQQAANTVMTVALVPVERDDATRFGVAWTKRVNGFNTICDFMEKPDIKDIPEKPWINAGVYALDTEFILSNIEEFLPDKPNTNLEKTLLERLARSKEPKLAAYLLDLYAWFDIGTLEQIIDVNIYIASRKGGYPPP
jgi:NDP-sugar pyrophosphorylase family protein